MDVKRTLRRWGPTARLVSEAAWRRRVRSDAVLRECRAQITPGSVAVDVGAFDGVYALGMRWAAGRGGGVIAFEPNPESFAALQRRTWGSGVDARWQAVSDVPALLTLHVPSSEAGAEPKVTRGSLIEPVGGGLLRYEVEAVTLDDALAVDAARLSLIKVDAEGWESQVLAGAESILAAHRPTLIVEIEQRHLDRRDMRASAVVESIARFGYEVAGISSHGLIPWADYRFDLHQRVDGEGPYVSDFLFRAAGSAR